MHEGLRGYCLQSCTQYFECSALLQTEKCRQISRYEIKLMVNMLSEKTREHDGIPVEGA